MLTTTTPKFSGEYLRNEFSSLGIKRPGKVIVGAVLLILAGSFATHVVSNIEYAGQDALFRGPRIFSWLKMFLPPKESNPDDEKLHPELPLFAEGKVSIEPNAVRQNGIYDCRFLAALASYARSDSGKDTIYKMIEVQKNGSYSVKFPGLTTAIVVPPLSGRELRIYSRAVGPTGYSTGIWVPVIEKAYGTYLDKHQSLDEKVFHTIRHGIMDGRWTATPELPGFAASYGAKDERACNVLTGHDMEQLWTTSMELGDFGLGKGYVTMRQVKSWLNRDRIVSEYYAEQDAALKKAFSDNRIVIATTGIQENAEAYGLMEHHAYAVTAYDADSKRLLIRDVLNRSYFSKPGEYIAHEPDLTKPFWIPIAEFNTCFSGLSIEKASGSGSTDKQHS